MKILGIDTALGACSAALLDGDRVIARAREEMQRGHAEALAPMVDDIFRQAGLKPRDLERIAVTTGPGTFTGQRVGIAFARALSLALKIPAVGTTSLDAMAAQALAEENASIALAVCDAKRDEVYLGGLRANGDMIAAPVVVSVSDAAERTRALMASENKSIVLAGTGAAMLASKLGNGEIALSTITQPDAVYVAWLGLAMPMPISPPRPLYLRAPDAKLPKRSSL